MNKIGAFIKATIIGGIIFLIPVIVVIFTIAKGFSLAQKVVKPIADKLNFTHIGGISAVALLTVLLLLFVCFLAGIFMRTDIAKKIKNTLEEQVLMYVPGYSYLHALSTDKLAKNDDSNWKPAAVMVNNAEFICFVIDATETHCSVFMPLAPSPSTGTVCVYKKENVRYLKTDLSETIAMLHHFGKGAAAIAEGAAG